MIMKPIVVLPKGIFEMSGKELRDLIEQAYEQGFSDGQAAGRNVIINPYTPYVPYRPYITWTCSTADRAELYASTTGASADTP